jgi:eukaryotic-like serine/threonine-protein kinase
VLVGVALSVVLALVLFTVLHDPAPTSGQASGPASQRPTAATSSTATSPTPSPTARTSHPPARPHPTASGMRSFIRSYVAAVGSDPDTAWQMLTPKFQRQSGGLRTYRDFWRGVGAGRVRDIAVDPRNLVVSYRVRFDHFGTGRRPTVLTLAFDGDRYRIDGEHTPGFVPAG